MWIYPTYNRPSKCDVVLQHIKKYGCSTFGVIIVQGTDFVEEYKEILSRLLPPNWLPIFLPENIGFCSSLNLVYSMFPTEKCYGVVSDDEVTLSENWDTILQEAAGSWHVANGNNGWQSAVRSHGYTTFGGELVRTMGYIAPPGLWHWYIDNLWEHLINECGLRKYRLEVLLEDRHYLIGKSVFDATYELGQSRAAQDKQIYEEWLQNSAPDIIKRIKERDVSTINSGSLHSAKLNS